MTVSTSQRRLEEDDRMMSLGADTPAQNEALSVIQFFRCINEERGNGNPRRQSIRRKGAARFHDNVARLPLHRRNTD